MSSALPEPPRKSTSGGPYYKESCAQFLKSHILSKLLAAEQKHADKLDFLYKSFFVSTELFNISEISLRTYITQAWNFVIDRWDTKDKDFKSLRERIYLTIVPGGVLIRYKEHYRKKRIREVEAQKGITPFSHIASPEIIEEQEVELPAKDPIVEEIKEYLDRTDNDNTTFEKEGQFPLKTIREIKTIVAENLDVFPLKIKPSEIKLVKNKEMAEQVRKIKEERLNKREEPK